MHLVTSIDQHMQSCYDMNQKWKLVFLFCDSVSPLVSTRLLVYILVSCLYFICLFQNMFSKCYYCGHFNSTLIMNALRTEEDKYTLY